MKPEQAALLHKAESSLKAARLLASEGYHDFAASRAYYAMFYAAEALLLGAGLSYSKHSAVIAAFGQHFARTRRLDPELHDYLIKAQEARILSDYGVEFEDAEAMAAVQIERAARFVACARALLEE
ncbi:MAG: HEPN domain-containing protein [Actinobacteria bacterium]|nr:HEPN domain-containing protein [Actinomycetota bacterium]